MLGKFLRELSGPIMVTGHTGFKGTWLTFLLERLNVPVVGLSLPAERDSLFDRSKRTGSVSEAFLDIRDGVAVAGFIAEHQPSAIIHMAAQPLVLESYKTPRETFEINVMGTVNVLDSAFKTDCVKAVVVVTTDKVYRNDNLGSVFVETDPLEGKDPYSASKVGTESVVSAWQQIAKVSGGPKVISVRAGNVIGGGDWATNRLIPDLIRGLISGKPTMIRHPQSTRPWQYVLDPLYGYLLALEAILRGKDIKSLNFGPENASLSVLDVVRQVEKLWEGHHKAQLDDFSIGLNQEAVNLNLNSKQAEAILKWQPRVDQLEAVSITTLWWKDVLINGRNPVDLCDRECWTFLES